MHKSCIPLRCLSLYLSSYFIHSNLLRLYPLYILFIRTVSTIQTQTEARPQMESRLVLLRGMAFSAASCNNES